MASSSPGVWVWVFFPTPLVFPGRGVLSSSSRMTRSGVASHLRFLAFGSSALSERGSSSDGLPGGCFPQTFSQYFEPELEALLEGCEIRLAGAHFRRLAIESSWSPKESTGPVDFFWCFSSSWHASASSFRLTSSPQNNPAACLAECFFPESGGGSLGQTRYVLASGYGHDPLHQGRWPAGQTAGRAQEGQPFQ